MKKIVVFLLTIVFIVSLAACGENTDSSTPVNDEFKNENQILSLVNNYNVDRTSGFDYSLEQKLQNTVVNAHTISIRLNNTNGVIGYREEYIKSLNEDITQGQFTEVESAAYYKNGKILTLVNNSWVWNDCDFNEFASVSISSFGFDVTKLKDLKLSDSGKYSYLTFKIDDEDAASFLGVNAKINNLSFEIKTNSNKDKLISFTMSYSQNLTTTQFVLTPYYGSVNISIPS